MFYRLDENNKIIDSAEFEYADDCLETDRNIIRGYDGGLYFEGEEPQKPQELIEQEKIAYYESLIVSKIRKKYTLDQELAILRQRDSKPEEFSKYNEYVEQCKLEAKQEV